MKSGQSVTSMTITETDISDTMYQYINQLDEDFSHHADPKYMK